MAKSNASHALQWAEEGQASSAVLLTAQRLIRLQGAISKHLPAGMQEGFAVADFKAGELTIIANHAALAAKLRQMQTTLLKHIESGGWHVTALKIKVATRPNTIPTQKIPKQARPLDESDLSHFEALGHEVRPGPLADAIAGLLARHKRLKT